MPVKIFHTADLHIGAEVSYLGSKAEERRFEIASVFKNIVGYCAENKVEICLIAGDLFDSNSVAGEFAPSVFEYIKAVPETKFFYVAGNHDPLDAVSPMNSKVLPENLHVFGSEYESAVLENLGVRIIGRSFSHSSMEPKEYGKVPENDGLINVMLLHADISSDKSNPYNPIDRDFIENSGVDYLALGHIHKRTAPTKLGKTTFAYPGCPEGHGFDEEGIKGGYLINIDKDSCDISFVRLCRRVHRIENIDISKAVSSINAADIVLSALKERHGENYRNDLYKIILSGNIEESVTLKTAEILQILKDNLYFVKLKNSTRKKYDLEQLKCEVTLKGVFVKKMLEKINSVSENEKELYENALHIGLSAFDSEVTLLED